VPTKLSRRQFKKGQLPTWNPYSFSGTPLLANFQTGAFYPLNILFFILPFTTAWSILIVLQAVLAAAFMYLFLRELTLGKQASILASFIFPFCGYSVAWMEWGTIGHTLLWLPLILLSIEKLTKKITFAWSGILLGSLISSFFAGHLQTFFYVGVFSFIYFLAKIFFSQKKETRHFLGKKILLFLFISIIFIAATSLQWLPTFQFISLSARSIDQGTWQKEGWFIPIVHLLQFLAPDYFGNPATGNYFGVFNYGEFVGYIGIIPLIFALSSLVIRKDRKTAFFGTAAFISLLFAVENPVSKIPFLLQIPFISTSMPTRLLSIADFSLTVLAALGLDYFLRKQPLKKTFTLSLLLLFVICSLYISSSVPVTRNNLYLSILIAIISTGLLFLYRSRYKRIVVPILVFVTVLDLFRFGSKFLPFSDPSLVFPKSEILTFLHEVTKLDAARVIANDRRILPPNVSVRYKIQDVSGYDPLYLLSYNLFTTTWNTASASISGSTFNRIVTPENYDSSFTDLIGAKYLLSLDEVKSLKWTYLLNIGQTRVYQNKFSFPRAFLVGNVIKVSSDNEVLSSLISEKDLLHTAYAIDTALSSSAVTENDSAQIDSYEENRVVIKVNAVDLRMLVFTDVYYPTWKVYVDGKESKLYKVNYLFRGVLLEKGRHSIEFKNKIF
jgi:uncharacterized membrane protein YfhO